MRAQKTDAIVKVSLRGHKVTLIQNTKASNRGMCLTERKVNMEDIEEKT